jgi:phosphoribosylformimino-5-aminoimidazole carboxamide ribotide isomerase
MNVIPAIDLLDGNVVRLTKGSYEEVTIYNESPLNEAQKFAEAGFSHIHIVDLNGARKGKFVNLSHIEEIKRETGLSIQMGGGIRHYEKAKQLLEAGINQLICGSMPIKNRSDWIKLLQQYPGQMILGMDLKEGEIAYDGWLKTSDEPINSFLAPMVAKGLKYVLCTDISRDGMLQGANIKLYKSLQEKYPSLRFIASGGVSDIDDLKELQQAKLYGVVIGRAYYEDRLSLKEMKLYQN